jgi:hypothetical protein
MPFMTSSRCDDAHDDENDADVEDDDDDNDRMKRPQ